MIELVDTHCHIQSIGLRKGEPATRELWAKANLTANEVIENAAAAGATRLVCVGCDLEDSRLAIDFAKDREGCFVSVGIHPHEAQHFAGNQAKLDEFAALAKSPKVVAVGECGLDFFYTHSPKVDQVKVLRFQIELALSNDLPLIFHVREAFEDFWPIFEEYQGIRGVLHSFTDSEENLKKALNYGLFIGVNGIATFAKNPAQLQMYKAIPLENLLLETDAPFLTPTPYRGSINEPRQVETVSRFLAEMRDQKYEDLATVTTRNARHLFGL
ncbi:MAG TPA: TatD family hydrolase [Candidatus Saccharimonadales bacterium]|nr:TatD family hydrolase [Candidatus Saccharimonadales bacterium]